MQSERFFPNTESLFMCYYWFKRFSIRSESTDPQDYWGMLMIIKIQNWDFTRCGGLVLRWQSFLLLLTFHFVIFQIIILLKADNWEKLCSAIGHLKLLVGDKDKLESAGEITNVILSVDETSAEIFKSTWKLF